MAYTYTYSSLTRLLPKFLALGLLGHFVHNGKFVMTNNLGDPGLPLLCLPKFSHGDPIDQMSMILVSLHYSRVERVEGVTSGS